MYEIFEQLLKQRGLTAYKVAKDTGMSPSMFSDWKQGKYEPKTDKMKRLADYFGISVDYLTTGKSIEGDYYLDDNAKDLAQFLFENPEYRVLFDASRKVKKEDVAIVKELIDRFAR